MCITCIYIYTYIYTCIYIYTTTHIHTMHNVRKSDFAKFRSSLCLLVAFAKRLDMLWILIVYPVAAALACCLFAAWKYYMMKKKYRVLMAWLNHVVCSFSRHGRSWTRTPFPLAWRLGTWSSSSLGRFAPFHFQTVPTVLSIVWWTKLQNQARHGKIW